MSETACPGPFIWYFVGPGGEGGAILHCATCGQLTVTGNWNDPAHAFTPYVREALQ